MLVNKPFAIWEKEGIDGNPGQYFRDKNKEIEDKYYITTPIKK